MTNGGTLSSTGNYIVGNLLTLSSGGQNYFDGTNGLTTNSGLSLFSGTNVLTPLAAGGSLNFGGGNVTFQFPGSATLVALVGASTGSNLLSANLTDNAGPSSTGLTSVLKSGAGIWILSGASSYTGGTTINQGTLGVASASGAATVRSISTPVPSVWAG